MEVVPYILSLKEDYICNDFIHKSFSKSLNKFIGLYSSFEEIENC